MRWIGRSAPLLVWGLTASCSAYFTPPVLGDAGGAPPTSPVAMCTSPPRSWPSSGVQRAGETTCTPDTLVDVGCSDAQSLGSCSGDAILQVCDGADTASGRTCDNTAALGSNDDCGGLCPALQVRCPPSGRIAAFAFGYNGRSFTCSVAFRGAVGGSMMTPPPPDGATCGQAGQPPCGGGGESGPPSEIGCSDGTREAFSPRAQFPNIAGCAAQFNPASLRSSRSLPGAVCGNAASSSFCNSPADACAPGWSVCGSVNGPSDITRAVPSPSVCDAQPGRFVAALGDMSCQACGTAFGSGAVCCGTDCMANGGSCVWPGATRHYMGTPCGEFGQADPSPRYGVLCCRTGGG